MSFWQKNDDKCIISSEYIDKRVLFAIKYKDIADYIGETVSVNKIRNYFIEGTCPFEIYKSIIAFFNKCEYYLGYKNKGKKFGAFLKKYREELGVSQYELGVVLNKDIESLQQKINAVENGKAILSVKEQYDLLYYLYGKCLDFKKEYIKALEKKGKALYKELGLQYPKEIVSKFRYTIASYARKIPVDELKKIYTSLEINEIDFKGICSDNDYVYDANKKLTLYAILANYVANNQNNPVSNWTKNSFIELNLSGNIIQDHNLPIFDSQQYAVKKAERKKEKAKKVLDCIEKYPEKLQAFIIEELLELSFNENLFGASKFFSQYAEYIPDLEIMITQNCVINGIIVNDIRKLSEEDRNRISDVLAECITLPAPKKKSGIPYYIGKLYQFKTYAGKDGIINNIDKIPRYEMKSKLSDLYENSQVLVLLVNVKLIDDKLTFSEDEWYVYILLVLASLYNQDITPFFEELKKLN